MSFQKKNQIKLNLIQRKKKKKKKKKRNQPKKNQKKLKKKRDNFKKKKLILHMEFQILEIHAILIQLIK